MADEHQVKLAAQLYDMRDKARRMLGDKYPAHMAELGKILTMTAARDGKAIELSSLSTRFHEVIKVACPGAYADGEWPSLHEARSLSERLYRAQGINTQTLLGHSSQEMTDKYNDDRGLSAKQFKRVAVAQAGASTENSHSGT